MPKPESALAVVIAVQRALRRSVAIHGTPRVFALKKALETINARSHGHETTDVSRKMPMRMEIMLHARDCCADKEVAGRNVDWSSPFWTCIWAVLMTLWYMGARKSDVLPTAKTPFDRSRMSRESLTFHKQNAILPRNRDTPTAEQLAPIKGGLVRIRLGASKADQTGAINAMNDTVLSDDGEKSPANGAAALHAYVSACPLGGRAPNSVPLFFVPNDVPITGELVDKILKAMLSIALGADAPQYSLHSMRIGAATALRAAGYTDEQICRAFRWASIPCMLGYATVGVAERVGVSRSLRNSASAAQAATAALAAPTTSLALVLAGDNHVRGAYAEPAPSVVATPSSRDRRASPARAETGAPIAPLARSDDDHARRSDAETSAATLPLGSSFVPRTSSRLAAVAKKPGRR
jgi:hypothetical protein